MQTKARIYGMRNKVQYEAKAEDNGINNNDMRNLIIKDVGRGYYCWMPLSSVFASYCTLLIMPLSALVSI